MIFGKAKLLLIIGGLTGALVAGWQARGWLEASRDADAYAEALKETQNIISTLQAEYEAEVQKSLTLEKQNAGLRDSVAALREDIADADLTPVIVDGCAVHPVASPNFRMLYDQAAIGGERADHLSGVPEGND